MPITAEDIKALKLAEKLTLHSYINRETRERLSWLGITLEKYSFNETPVVFSKAEQLLFTDLILHDGTWRRRRVTADAVSFQQYGVSHDTPVAYASCSDAHLRTLRSLLRVGDEVRLHFVADNNNDNVRNASLHVDEAWVVVARKGKTVAELLVDVSVCPDNTARMVRPA